MTSVRTTTARRKSTAARRAPVRRATRKAAPKYASALGALAVAEDSVVLELDGAEVTLTHLDKVLWPAPPRSQLPEYTRRDFVRYLLEVGPYMLPHVRNRPLTLIRMPEGIRGRRFVQFHWEQRLPEFVDTLSIYSEKSKVAEAFLLCNNMPTLLWLAHVGTLEIHVWHSRADPQPDAKGVSTDYASSASAVQSSLLNYPDYLVFDIDPYIYSGEEAKGDQPEFNEAAFEKGKEVAFLVKELLDSMKLKSFVKTSGKTGLHILVPVVRNVRFDAARAFAETIARHLVRTRPELVTIDWNTTRRTGKVFFDYTMNIRVKTLSAPYSVRSAPGAPVSMPIEWKALAKAHPLDYSIRNASAVLAKQGDLWADIFEAKQDLAAVLRSG